MSADNLHNEMNPDEKLRSSFDSWNPGETPDLWESLNESLSVENVWTAVSDSLDNEQPAFDEQLRTGFNNWETDGSKDLWAKLDESLSVEKVWTNLDESLQRVPTSKSGWWRGAAACILVLFFVRTISDEKLVISDHSEIRSANTAVVENTIPENTAAQHAENNFTAKEVSQLTKVENRPISQNKNREFNKPERNAGISGENQIGGNVNNLPPDIVETEEDSLQETAEVSEVGNLPFNRYAQKLALEQGVFPSVSSRYDHWLIQAGTQLSFLRDDQVSDLSTAKTRVGIAADLAYRQRFGNLQLTGALGISQFEQEKGNYVNARYTNTRQKINMAQFSVCLGYNYKSLHFYGGPILSNALTALEFSSGTITQVYNFRTVEPGLTAGIDYKLLDLRRNSNSLIVGAQYQYLPDNSLNLNLKQIHGLRFQVKFSF